MLNTTNNFQELCNDIMKKSSLILLKSAIFGIQLFLREVESQTYFLDSLYLKQDKMMHGVSWLHWVFQLEQKCHSISFKLRKLEHSIDILIFEPIVFW